jgi:hypothetical protein
VYAAPVLDTIKALDRSEANMRRLLPFLLVFVALVAG